MLFFLFKLQYKAKQKVILQKILLDLTRCFYDHAIFLLLNIFLFSFLQIFYDFLNLKNGHINHSVFVVSIRVRTYFRWCLLLLCTNLKSKSSLDCLLWRCWYAILTLRAIFFFTYIQYHIWAELEKSIYAIEQLLEILKIYFRSEYCVCNLFYSIFGWECATLS